MKAREQDMTDELLGRFQVMKQLASAGGLEYGVHWCLTAVLRTPAEQRAFYAQGRKTLAEVNALRQAVGMYRLAASENTYCVTWTLNSKHFPEIDTAKARAFDVAVLKNGKEPTWDQKWDNDKDKIGDYKELAQYGKQAGLDCGAYWEKPDAPHMQLPASIA